MPTALSAAIWMVEEFEAKGKLDQRYAAEQIREGFGPEHVFRNENGNEAIATTVLAHFDKMTEGTAVWSRKGFYWRIRRDEDPHGVRAVDW